MAQKKLKSYIKVASLFMQSDEIRNLSVRFCHYCLKSCVKAIIAFSCGPTVVYIFFLICIVFFFVLGINNHTKALNNSKHINSMYVCIVGLYVYACVFVVIHIKCTKE